MKMRSSAWALETAWVGIRKTKFSVDRGAKGLVLWYINQRVSLLHSLPGQSTDRGLIALLVMFPKCVVLTSGVLMLYGHISFSTGGWTVKLAYMIHGSRTLQWSRQVPVPQHVISLDSWRSPGVASLLIHFKQSKTLELSIPEGFGISS